MYTIKKSEVDAMKNNIKKILLWIVSGIFVFSFVFVSVGFNFAKAQTNGLDIVLAIDSSGSMVETDPNNLRITAARIFIDLSSPSDRIGEIDFDESVKILSNLTFVKDKYVKEKLKKNLNEINSNGDTDFLKAFRAAESTFSRSPLSGRRKILVFLTDGEPHPDSRIDKDPSYRKKYMTNLYEEIDTLKKKGIEVYSIGLSKYADMDLLREISKNTNGAYFNASKASDLNVIFTEILRNLKNENIKSINPGDNGFEISPLVKEMDVLSTRSNPSSFIYLDSPDNDIITPKTPNIYYAEGKYYQLYMTPSVQSGEWKLKGNNYSNVTIWVLEKMKVILDIVSPSENTTILPGKPVNIDVKVIGRSPGEDLSKINPSELSMTVEIAPTNKNYTSQTISLHQVGNSGNYLSQFKGTWEKPLPGSDYWLNFILTYKGENILTKKIIVYGPPNVPSLALEKPLNNSIIPFDGELEIVASVAGNTSQNSVISECKGIITDLGGKKIAIVPLELSGSKFIGHYNASSIHNGCFIGLEAITLLKTKEGKTIPYKISLPKLAHIVAPVISVSSAENSFVLNKSLSCTIPIQYKSTLPDNTDVKISIDKKEFELVPQSFTLSKGVDKNGSIPTTLKLKDNSKINFKNPYTYKVKITINPANHNVHLNNSCIESEIVVPSWIQVHKLSVFVVLLFLLLLIIVFLIKWMKTPIVAGTLINKDDKDDRVELMDYRKFFAKNTCVVNINDSLLKFVTENRISSNKNDEDEDPELLYSESPFETYVILLQGNLVINSFPVNVLQKEKLKDGDVIAIGDKTYKFYYNPPII